uniref:Superkiller viralicidic activity 2-like 2 (inferred by orthology to a human protein) n=1 Tax=Strongyloides venezuelensis TaxID=75913 RepID=A0A0K0FRK5_STRVS
MFHSYEFLCVGLNSPVSACIFISFKKYDGNEKRYYKFDKFTQIAGRAGRRGIDEKEYVVIMTNKSLNIKILKDILKLKSSSMNS